MEIVVNSIAQKTDLITLDLLGPNQSSKSLDPPLQISSDNDDLSPLDLNRAPDDDALRPAAFPLPGSQSVCTIEEVKQALERETERQRGGGGGGSASTSASPSPSSSSSSVTTASIRRRADRGDEGSAADGGDGDSASASGSLVVAGCPGCLSYVLIPKGNPQCPRCDARLTAASVLSSPPPPPPTKKRTRIDLNFSLSIL